MNIPNLLTGIRIFLIPIFIISLIYNYYFYALWIFIFESITDSLDGLIARLYNQKTNFGKYFDPMADKLLLTSAFVTLSVLNIVPLWLTIIVVSRDIMLVMGTLILHLTQNRLDVSPTIVGKATTLFQLIYIISVLLFIVLNKSIDSLSPIVWIITLITIISCLHYLYRGFKLINGIVAL
ncbi:MAG: CDP-alcohol phosphatidyltransferase family protein [Nitrospirota bacterium]